MPEKQAARATGDNSLHDEAGWHALAKIRSWNPCAVAGLGEALWIAVWLYGYVAVWLCLKFQKKKK